MANVADLVVQVATENSRWGCDRKVGAFSNLEHRISDQSVGNTLRSHGIPPASRRSANTTWKDFIAADMGSPGWCRCLYRRGTHLARTGHLFTFCSFCIWRPVGELAVIMRYPSLEWMEQIGRNAVDEVSAHARHIR
jgi:hypothetical protein